MTIRNITIKRMNASDEIREIDDAKTAFIRVFHKAATLSALFIAHQNEDKKERAKECAKVKADFEIAFDATENNLHRLSKQMRAKQRAQNIRLSADKSLTHYQFTTRNVKIDTRSVKKTTIANVQTVYHLYEAKNVLNEADFIALQKFVSDLK